MKDKKNLLVTLADENYIDQAKQLFSSVYWNAGWKGDYMLLAHEIPEKKLKWFRNKGILVKKCKPIFKIKDDDFGIWPPTVFSKFYLFTPEFKKWKNVVYLDADIIVRASLDRLTEVNGFGAVIDIFYPRLINQVTKINKDIFINLKKKYNLRENAFSSGVLAFSTDVIEKGTFQRLKKLMNLYGRISKLADQPIINLFFYKEFTKLPYVYNYYADIMIRFCNIRPEKIKGIILHFVGQNPPWLMTSIFYPEWKSNLEKAEYINLKKIPAAKEKWANEDIRKYSSYLKWRSKLYFPNYAFWKIWLFFDMCIGLIGIFLKKHSPKLYFKIKKLKDRK